MDTCNICGKPKLHGSQINNYSDMGCHDGVWMDDDVYNEGWHSDVIYPPCPNNPVACDACHGAGSHTVNGSTFECDTCSGFGWKNSEPHWPDQSVSEAKP